MRQEARTVLLGSELDSETEMVKLKPLYPATSSSGPDTKSSLNLFLAEMSWAASTPPPQREETLVMSCSELPDWICTKDWRQ